MIDKEASVARQSSSKDNSNGVVMEVDEDL
jgi:26S proteasome regulatory subunit N11